MRIQLSEHFSYKKLFIFVLPSIIMMIFTSLYSIVDGLFVSNFVGKTAFAAVNLIMPFLMGIGTVGFMIGTGGSAVVAKTLGEKKSQLANEYFSMLVYIIIAVGTFFAILGQFLVRPLSIWLGAEGQLLEYCVLYGRIMLVSLPAFMLQYVFQSFYVAAEKPRLGLYMSIAAGVTNIVLDFVFIAIFHWGIAGAAFATAIGEFITGIFPIVYFSRKNDSLLSLTKPRFHGRVLLKSCTNGSSELMTTLSSSVVNALYNMQLMKLAGEDGIAAYGAIMYVNFIFVAIYIGYAVGSAPVVSYNYGAKNTDEMKSLFRKSIISICTFAVAIFSLAQLLAVPLSGIFVGYDAELMAMTCKGFRICALTFLVCGINIYGSSFFTALSNGLVSAFISFMRTLVFQVSMIFLLPQILGLTGVWVASSFAELLTLTVTVTFFIGQRKKYQYI